MIKIIKRLVFNIGVITVLFILYISSFYLISGKIIQPFERENSAEAHVLRPVYNVVYYPMRIFTANKSSFHQDIPDEYFGTLEKRINSYSDESEMRSASIDQIDGGLISIGFTGRASILREYDRVGNGSYVRLLFGRALTNEHDRFINRLNSIEVIDLMDDPRIEKKEYTFDEAKVIGQKYSRLTGAPKECAQKLVSEYKEKVLQHCLIAGYARNIGGGCYHLLPYFANTTVLEQVLSECQSLNN